MASKKSRFVPVEDSPPSRRFYHWPSAIGVQESRSAEDRKSEVLNTIKILLDEHFSLVRDDLSVLHETTGNLKESLRTLKEENVDLKHKLKFLQDENGFLFKDVSDLKAEVKLIKKFSGNRNPEMTGVVPSTSDDGNKNKTTEIGDLEIGATVAETNKIEATKVKFTTRSAKTEWFWTAAKEKKSSSGSNTSEESLTPGKTGLGKQRKGGKEKRMPYAWANNCRIVGENSTDSDWDASWWDDEKNLEKGDGTSEPID